MFDINASQQSQFHTETGDVAQESRYEHEDEGGAYDFPDPWSQYVDGLQQSRHNNEQEDSDSSDDEITSGEEEEEGGSYDPMELDTAAGQSAEADWLSYISRLSHSAKLDSMKTAMAYIEALKTASLYDECSKLDADTLYQL